LSDCRLSARSWFFRFALLLGVTLWSVVTVSAQPLVLELESATVGYDQRTAEPVIALRMTRVSGRAFAELTKNNVGRPMELRVDGRSLSKPVIREPVLGGSVQISGNFAHQEAEDLAARLSAGAAKVEVEVVD
jgi:preprotein translocase subunit SecD